MEKEGGRTTTGLYSCLCSAQLPGAKIEGWRVPGWFLRVILALLWVGEPPVHVWGVLSSEILVPNQTKQTKTSLCFCRRISQGYQEMKMDTKSHPPPKKKTQPKKNPNCVYMYVYTWLSLYRGHFAGTLCCTDLKISACLCLLHLLHCCSLCFRGKN